MKAGVAELISDRMDAMPAGERRAAQALIASYPVIGLKTVAEFSQAAGVSSPTILRFVGAAGLPELSGIPGRTSGRARRSVAVAGFPRGHCRSLRGQASVPRDGRGDAGQHPRDVPASCRKSRSPTSVALLSNRKLQCFLIGGRFTDPDRALHGGASHDHPAERASISPARKATGATG